MKKDRYSLVTRNTEEVIVEDELRELLENKEEPVTYVGYEPSGALHLGHLLTANKLIDLQEAGFKVKVLLADFHAYLNEKGSLDEIKETAEMNKECFLAYGLDPEKTEFVFGSEYQLNDEYTKKVYELSLSVTLNRATRSMDEISRRRENPIMGQMLYPIMQAIDIGWLDVDVAMGGTDQRKIHMLAREKLPKVGYDSPICIHTPILTGLDGEKMSSSKDNWIDISDSSEMVREKIMEAYCPEKQVEGNPVTEIMRYHVMPRFDEIRVERPEKYGGDLVYSDYSELASDYRSGELHPLDLKNTAKDYLNRVLEPARKKLR
ncbi:tyrosine--tRNA ligase [Methanonatronarchaeum sp. AMET6-2]|uniref:tyrosine--tRNA ligase n=1 Tax=Methanonatronarchaeum sp. AMET6-2 TaxID=2933293 RepID=UPI0012133F19|nr:tyrosine--tRNA ligase [Methanonatronarchaeum sp. AMET6-2]RZN62239.1 MAG: tyrosine--tRNA ligase [Methanonatronarchaeia archaeon]UOY10425.1 tyrosine--tRNA ligase [Methanonatronarchaeum sp. AMET6-2]